MADRITTEPNEPSRQTRAPSVLLFVETSREFGRGLLYGIALNTEIAVHCGFDGVEHVSRYFRKETGISLRDYRKQHAPR